MTLNTSSLTDEQHEAINDLIEINLDSANGFRDAAENLDNAHYIHLFQELGSERDGFATTLQEALAQHGLKFETKGSTLAQAHRWWIDLRTKMTSNDDYNVLDEAKRGEDAIVDKYDDALETLGTTELTGTVAQQHRHISAGRQRIVDLRALEDDKD